jgi:hypothetical protein
MIPMKDVMGAVRFRVRDPQGTQVSDFQIIEAVGDAMRRIFEAGAALGLNFALKKTALFVENGEDGMSRPNTAALPRDFLRVRKVLYISSKELGYQANPIYDPVLDESKYRIYADTFEALPGAYLLEYWRLPPRVADANGLLPLPRSLEMPLIDAASAELTDGVGAAEAVIRARLSGMAGQENSGYLERGPLQVWGGKA